MGYRDGFMQEVDKIELFHDGASRNDRGLSQFHSRESFGEYPHNPDAYFVRLCRGKAAMEWLITEIASLYLTFEWPGWQSIRDDYADMPWFEDRVRSRLRMRINGR